MTTKPAPASQRRWLVCTMDDGILCRVPTKARAYRWLAHQGSGTVLKKRRVENGFYEVLMGYKDGERAHTYWVATPEAAMRQGFDPDCTCMREDGVVRTPSGSCPVHSWMADD
jgi:hypothetical protein